MDSIIKIVEKELQGKRKDHTYGVASAAVELANKYGGDPNKCQEAALLHDICKAKPVEELDKKIKEYGLPDKYLGKPSISHSKVGAAVIEHEFGITDEEILNAVKYHTTGREEMTLTEKIVYMADMIEVNRTFEGVNELRELAAIDLDRACLKSLTDTIRLLNEAGRDVDIDTINATKWLKTQVNNN